MLECGGGTSVLEMNPPLAGKEFITKHAATACLAFKAGLGWKIDSPIPIKVIGEMLKKQLKLKDCGINPIKEVQTNALQMMGLGIEGSECSKFDGKLVDICLCRHRADGSKVNVYFDGTEVGLIFTNPDVFGRLVDGVGGSLNSTPSEFIVAEASRARELFETTEAGKTLENPIKLGIVEKMISKKLKLKDHRIVPWMAIERLTLKMLHLESEPAKVLQKDGKLINVYKCKKLDGGKSDERVAVCFDQTDTISVFGCMPVFLTLTE